MFNFFSSLHFFLKNSLSFLFFASFRFCCTHQYINVSFSTFSLTFFRMFSNVILSLIHCFMYQYCVLCVLKEGSREATRALSKWKKIAKNFFLNNTKRNRTVVFFWRFQSRCGRASEREREREQLDVVAATRKRPVF